MDLRLIQELKNSWRNINSSTISFAQAVPPQEWATKPFESRFSAFSWEFACLARTRLVYLTGFRTGKLVFTEQENIPTKKVIEEWAKKEVLESLKESSSQILKEIEKINRPDAVDMVNWLFQHERIHHGKLLLYHSKAGFDLPKNFVKTWGEDNFHKPLKG